MDPWREPWGTIQTSIRYRHPPDVQLKPFCLEPLKNDSERLDVLIIVVSYDQDIIQVYLDEFKVTESVSHDGLEHGRR